MRLILVGGCLFIDIPQIDMQRYMVRLCRFIRCAKRGREECADQHQVILFVRYMATQLFGKETTLPVEENGSQHLEEPIQGAMRIDGNLRDGVGMREGKGFELLRKNLH